MKQVVKQALYSMVIFLLVIIPAELGGTIPYNLFNPYDVLIKPQRKVDRVFDFLVGYEYAFHARGFLGDDQVDDAALIAPKGNVLQLWQKRQDAIAAFKGLPATTEAGARAQFLNIDDDNRAQGFFVPSAKLTIPANLLFALQWKMPHNITFAAYLPYRVVHLDDVRWYESKNGQLFEPEITPSLITTLETVGGMNLGSWRRHGPGDLLLQAEYYFHAPQNKPVLRNVGIELRGGLMVPTGLPEDPDRLMALSFGHDAGFGIQVAGRLELWFVHHMRFGLDVELFHGFGTAKARRIKSDPAQTDLFLLAKVPTFQQPGFLQHYTFFLDCFDYKGFSGRLAYQHTKNTEEQLYVCVDGFDATVVNDAEKLQEWTTHDLLLQLSYTWHRPQGIFEPSFSLLGKYTFNGKRAIVADSITATVSLAF